MGRLVRWLRLFARRNPRTWRIFRNWAPPMLIVMVALSLLHQTVAADTAPSASQLQAYLAKNPLVTIIESVGDYQQIFYRYKDGYVKITDGDKNHAWATTDDHYVAWQEEDSGNAQLFLYDVYTRAKTQITSDGVNAEPSLSINTMVWRRYTDNDTWQIYFYNGFNTVQLTGGDHSYFHPHTDGNRIIYAEQLGPNQWRSHSYDIRTRQDSVIKEGDQVSAGYPRFGSNNSVTTSYRTDADTIQN